MKVELPVWFEKPESLSGTKMNLQSVIPLLYEMIHDYFAVLSAVSAATANAPKLLLLQTF